MEEWALERLNELTKGVGRSEGRARIEAHPSGFKCTWPLPSGQMARRFYCVTEKMEREGIHLGGQCGIVDSGLERKIQYDTGITSFVT